ncbi:protein rapunzel-like [Polypterus senegalus]|uniref:protein rapunzel-like n=1 Tax=Polypterus senegalus TaxID=55291 RepID=UPI0019667549|nr:protein rapunzel-like [Polypterus senegalus]XP_039608891.1 protein rapunzel-like [Polypterus senegalus]XP_039608897.1 protein rapunzel-like [Polypterus senegalus]
MSEISEDREKIKKGLKMALECVASISSAAAVVNPIFGLAGSIIRVVLHNIDDEDINTLKREFKSVHSGLDKISQQNKRTLMQIQKETLDGQYSRIEENIKNQFRKFMEIVEAKPEQKEQKKNKFEESFANDDGDQNLHTLYDGVMGKPKLFSKPILEVYMKFSSGDRRIMEPLCTRLTYLFCIGLIALMGYTAIIEDDEDEIREDWGKKMEDVQRQMQTVLSACH